MADMAADPALQRLRSIEHIVVLMMENRSFDQMLGYLKRANYPGLEDVHGLDGNESNPDPDGKQHQVFEWGPDETVFHPSEDPSGKVLDPDHSKKGVEEQLKDGNQGFVRDFVKSRPKPISPDFYRLPMGYYAAQHLPAYDFLARNHCVCDAWHSSVPGDTWPNRQFALTGREWPRAIPSVLERLAETFKHQLHFIEQAPIYDGQAFTRHLADGQWRWYSHDPATLRAVDGRYRDFGHPMRDNFAFFDRQKVSLLTEALEAGIATPDSFLDDAANGELRPVSWIDPNFIDLKVLDPNSDDDHPPSDVKAGQALVLEVYEALLNSPKWEQTMFVVVYDEHGGFYDHEQPPALPDGDESPYETYGVRVPALVIGPRVERQVSHALFDHTSLIKTILLRFADKAEEAIAQMGSRVAHARHLGELLRDDARTEIPGPEDARAHINSWRARSRAERRGSRQEGPSIAPDGAGQPFTLHDFQEKFVRFALAMRAEGLPPGQP
jgi:phospholipase C